MVCAWIGIFAREGLTGSDGGQGTLEPLLPLTRSLPPGPWRASSFGDSRLVSLPSLEQLLSHFPTQSRKNMGTRLSTGQDSPPFCKV